MVSLLVRVTKGSTVILAVAAVAAALLAGPAFTSSAGAVIQGGSCDAFSGAVALGASYTDSKVTVPACGPQPMLGGSLARVYAYPGARYTEGYQCVEFSERYLYYEFGVTMNLSTNGDQVVDHYAARYPSLFTAVKNGTTGWAPVQGDVLSFSGVSSFNSASGGHTAVVQSSSVGPAGNGSITIIEENGGRYAASGSQVLNVSNWKVQYSPDSYVEWLQPKSMPGGGSSAPALSAYSADQTWAGDQTNDINLTWAPPAVTAGAVTSYSILRNGVVIATVPGTTVSYTDTHLPDGGMLTYQVTAAESDGTSPPSNSLTLPYLPPGQSGLAWLGSSASGQISYCRRGGIGGSFSTQYLICTVFNGKTWRTVNSPGGIDWGYPNGRAWVLYNQHPAYCRRGGTGGSFATQYLLCTVLNGSAWTTYTSPAGIDWGYDTGWTWLATKLGITYCRRGGMGGSFSTQYLICTVFNGKTWRTVNSPAGIDWGYDPGASWVTLNGYPSYCRTTGVPPIKSQAVYCTTFNGTKWSTANSGGGIDWGYNTGRGWTADGAGVAYCRRGGTGGSFSTQYLICTVYNGQSWKTINSPAGIDWGYDPGSEWVTAGGHPSYCRTTGVPPLSAQAVYCTTFTGTKWTTANSGGGVDWGYPTGRAWVTTSTGAAYCRRAGTGGSFSTQYLTCTIYNGKTWRTVNSPGGIDWGYDT